MDVSHMIHEVLQGQDATDVVEKYLLRKIGKRVNAGSRLAKVAGKAVTTSFKGGYHGSDTAVKAGKKAYGKVLKKAGKAIRTNAKVGAGVAAAGAAAAGYGAYRVVKHAATSDSNKEE